MKKLFLLGFILFSSTSLVFSQVGYETNNNNVESSSPEFATGLGTGNTSTGFYSFIGGSNSSATASHSFGFGYKVKATADYSFVIGRSSIGGAIADYFENDTWSSLKIGFGTPSAQPSLMITGVGQESKFSPEYYGYVGIFTDNPQTELDVNGTIKTVNFKMPGGSEGYVLTYNGITGLAEWRQSLSGGSGGESLWNSNGTFVYYNTNNVGIGTSVPQEKLHVAGTILTEGGIKMLGLTNTIAFGEDPTSKFQIVRNEIVGKGTDPPPAGIQHKILTITADNFVGIGTDTPEAMLDVNGDTKTTDLEVVQNANVAGNISLNGSLNFDNSSGGIYYGEAGIPSSLHVLNTSGTTASGGKAPGSIEVFSISSDNKIGVLNANPTETLDVNGKIKTLDFQLASITAGEGKILQSDGDGNAQWVDAESLSGVGVWDQLPNGNIVFLEDQARVGIGIQDIPIEYRLAVNGTIGCKKVKVENSTDWPDYVFDDEYLLPNLYELEAFVKKNKHLPNVPNEKEVEENGIDVGEMNATLLQKIEELTLLIIQQQKQLDEQGDMIKMLQD